MVPRQFIGPGLAMKSPNMDDTEGKVLGFCVLQQEVRLADLGKGLEVRPGGRR